MVCCLMTCLYGLLQNSPLHSHDSEAILYSISGPTNAIVVYTLIVSHVAGLEWLHDIMRRRENTITQKEIGNSHLPF